MLWLLVPAVLAIGPFPCNYTEAGKTWTMSSLFNPAGYKVEDKSGNTFQINVCGSIKAGSEICKIDKPGTASAVWYNANAKNCTVLGEGDLYSFDRNPSKKGVYITNYHGALTSADTIDNWSIRIYFECGTTGSPEFEHFYPHSGLPYMAHFEWVTQLAC